MLIRLLLLSVVLILTFPTPFSLGMDPVERLFENARQNELLRHYFRNMLLETPTRPFDWRWPRRSSVALEDRIDGFIDRFSRKVVGGIWNISNTLDQLKEERRAFLMARSRESRVEALENLLRLFDVLSDQAGKLHRELSFPLVRLDSKPDFEPKISSEWLKSGFEKEVGSVEKEFRQAVKKVEAYFFTPLHTVQLGDLGSGNMLFHLHRIKKLAEDHQ